MKKIMNGFREAVSKYNGGIMYIDKETYDYTAQAKFYQIEVNERNVMTVTDPHYEVVAAFNVSMIGWDNVVELVYQLLMSDIQL